MRLSPAAFNSWLSNIGQQAAWRRAHACPCRDPHSGAAQPDCPVCSSRGWFWDAPVAAVAGIAGQKVQREWANFGRWQSGDVVVTIGSDSPLYAIGEFDRVVLLNAIERFSLIKTRGEDDVLDKPSATVAGVFWRTDAGAIVQGGIPTIGAGGALTWSAGAPPDGEQYTIEGTANAEYYCWGMYPQNRNEHQGAALPKRVVLRLFDLFGREGAAG